MIYVTLAEFYDFNRTKYKYLGKLAYYKQEARESIK